AHRAPGAARSSPRPGPTEEKLERAQEVQHMLLITFAQAVVPVDHGVGLRRAELAAGATPVGLDGLVGVLRAAVVQEEDALAETPQRRGPELVTPGPALQ